MKYSDKKVALKHLKDDKKRWEKLAKMAMKEAKEDADLIKRLKKRK